ncbi:MAG: hypothetical protein Satyrvirus5_17 [Satyrvirus sp.]|uniref:Uncharacterized protein n=1 Tax=Satyrvirus sp. TaxID=2487771 RepID=A0A3G5AFV3_9VIRU|nr:MAG: hypothetical protein Satyrvirus5_16 [Satyrvirus sp.]AYV85152.1 MAG: hypothetical protein Satyrvirus5_17 [Satyrvirus sp.]
MEHTDGPGADFFLLNLNSIFNFFVQKFVQ